MIVPPSNVRVWLATGTTDMRRGMNSLPCKFSKSWNAIRMKAIFMFSADAAVIF
jgi:hypothetical protein